MDDLLMFNVVSSNVKWVGLGLSKSVREHLHDKDRGTTLRDADEVDVDVYVQYTAGLYQYQTNLSVLNTVLNGVSIGSAVNTHLKKLLPAVKLADNEVVFLNKYILDLAVETKKQAGKPFEVNYSMWQRFNQQDVVKLTFNYIYDERFAF